MNPHFNRIVFQGKSKGLNSLYFEGWYFKQTTSDDSSISFIPGVSYNEKDPHAFVQCIYLDGQGSLNAHNFRYEVGDFQTRDHPFEVRIGGSVFSETGLDVYLEDQDIIIEGSIAFNHPEPLKMTTTCPNIMGFFSYIPKMECNHHIVSMHHNLSGSILYGKDFLNFEQGHGYIEKDWGSSFPSEYIWIQSNDFGDDAVRLSCSVASIPMSLFTFQGFFCALIIGEEHYRFATYNASRITSLKVNEKAVDMIIQKRGLKLRIQAKVDAVKELASPRFGEMSETIKEGLSGKVVIQLMDDSGCTLYKGKGKNCGIEIEMESRG